MREFAIKTLCVGLDVIDAVTGKIPLMCAVFGHKWGTRTESDRIANRFYCVRCPHVEIADNTDAYLNAVNQAYAQAGMSAPVMMQDVIAACQYGGLEN